jgi:hypothetical protein
LAVKLAAGRLLARAGDANQHFEAALEHDGLRAAQN